MQLLIYYCRIIIIYALIYMFVYIFAKSLFYED